MLGSFYKRAFERHPWCTLAVTNGSLTLLADGLAQVYEHRSLSEATQTWDTHRSGRFLIFGTAVAPLLAEWNKFLEFRFSIRSATGTMLWGGLFRRLFMDQILFAPFGLALFVGSMGIMEGRRTPKELSEKFNDVCGSMTDPRCMCQLFWRTGRFGLSCKPLTLVSCLCGTSLMRLMQAPRTFLGLMWCSMDLVSIHFKPTEGCNSRLSPCIIT